VIDLAILGTLREHDRHGYDLRKRIAERVGIRAISFGSLYPALSRLEAAGAVRTVESTARAALPVIPMTGSLSGEANAFLARQRAAATRAVAGLARGKRVFGITNEGESLLQQLLVDPATDDRDFALKVAFCRYLSPDRRVALFERRRAQLVARLAEPVSHRGVEDDPLDPYLSSLRERDRQLVVLDLAWLDQLITAEHSRVGVSGSASHGPEQEDNP